MPADGMVYMNNLGLCLNGDIACAHVTPCINSRAGTSSESLAGSFQQAFLDCSTGAGMVRTGAGPRSL